MKVSIGTFHGFLMREMGQLWYKARAEVTNNRGISVPLGFIAVFVVKSPRIVCGRKSIFNLMVGSCLVAGILIHPNFVTKIVSWRLNHGLKRRVVLKFGSFRLFYSVCLLTRAFVYGKLEARLSPPCLIRHVCCVTPSEMKQNQL